VSNWTMNWRGDEVARQVMRQVSIPALVDIGLDVEGEAKKQLQPGHGVLTGTLRRSIHAAEADYNFGSDDVSPSGSSPERGGKTVQTDKAVIAVGSGLEYAMAVHQGHHSFGGYHFMTKALNIVKGRVKTHVERHRVK